MSMEAVFKFKCDNYSFINDEDEEDGSLRCPKTFTGTVSDARQAGWVICAPGEEGLPQLTYCCESCYD